MNKEKQSPSKNNSSPSGPSNPSSNTSKKSQSAEKKDKKSSSNKKPEGINSSKTSSKAIAEQNLSVGNKDLVLDDKITENEKSASVEGPAISLPEPSPTVVKPIKTNTLRVIDEKLLKEPEQVPTLQNSEKRKAKSVSQLEQEFMEPEPGTSVQKTAKKPRWSKNKRKQEEFKKWLRSENPIEDEEEQPLKKKVKLSNKLTGNEESSKKGQANPEKIKNPLKKAPKSTSDKKENLQSEKRMSSEPEVILVGECDSIDDMKRENEEMRKEKEVLLKQLDELKKDKNDLKKENEEFKTKVAQYQKGAVVWNGTLARSKTDLAEERKKSALKSQKISELSKEKLSKEKKLTDELNDLKKQLVNHSSDVEKERDQLDSDLMDLKEEKSKQDVIIEELKLKIKALDSVNMTNKVSVSRRDDKNDGSNPDVINQAGKLKIKQIEKTLQERKEGWLKKVELYKDKLAAKEEKTNELEELLESKDVDLTNMRNDLEAMEKERDDLDSTLVDLRTELGEKELIIVQLESKQNENKEVEEKLAELNEKLKEKSDMIKQQTIVIKRLNSQKAELESSKIDVNKKVVEIESMVSGKQDEIEKLKSKNCELKQKLEENESGSTISTLENQNKHLQDELSKHEIELTRMKKYKEMFLNLANSM